MEHTYKVTGMTCTGCQYKVQTLLSKVTGVKHVDIDLAAGEAHVAMDQHVATSALQEALKEYPKYQLSEAHVAMPTATFTNEDQPKSWLQTYKPILLIFGYILTISLIAGSTVLGFDELLAMRVFMAGFFLTFSFFKMLDLDGFADSYAMYDVVARRFKGWGYIYALLELVLGLAFALNIEPVITNIVTLVVMTISIVGVLQSVLNKKTIRCACLGSVFNLPMSTVTIIEDGLMIIMSGIMLATMM
ncbi:heavy-metal-associated domain-containing protein [Mucilaginibacter agri]|uniref:Heavy-metal-associated domain-containing protein n=1 Tax=Mucilaginibacter agri TaxID=2695265 RepID=A0A966DS88_9SPHI|nr:heavy metal-associated domain-containing protein [Mucilaginibacter agri]NCD69878.1 heavy-metal-associated domain-containing protein [Mucilaginibacter agri]